MIVKKKMRLNQGCLSSLSGTTQFLTITKDGVIRMSKQSKQGKVKAVKK
jgi:hypothetical protein